VAIRERLEAVNNGAFRGLPTSRRELFEELEKGALRPLPASRYEFADWKRSKLNIDYHIELEHRYYSAPYRLVRQEVEVRVTTQAVEIFHRGSRVASHKREYGSRRFITDSQHMPASHRAHLEWTPSRLVRWAATAGPAAAEPAETILRTRPRPEQGYRACLGLMHLEKRYGGERLNAACQRALTVGGSHTGAWSRSSRTGSTAYRPRRGSWRQHHPHETTRTCAGPTTTGWRCEGC
jgi:transposase